MQLCQPWLVSLPLVHEMHCIISGHVQVHDAAAAKHLIISMHFFTLKQCIIDKHKVEKISKLEEEESRTPRGTSESVSMAHQHLELCILCMTCTQCL